MHNGFDTNKDTFIKEENVMKKFVLTLTILAATIGFINPHLAAAYNFGDFRSETLTTKAWIALKESDIEAVLAYTNKCLELYAEQAKKNAGKSAGLPARNQ